MFQTEAHKKAKPNAEGPKRSPSPRPGESGPLLSSGWQLLALRTGSLQPKLAVSQPGDPDEQDADRIADRVMRTAPPSGESGLSFSAVSPPRAQRKCAPCKEDDEEKKLLRKAESGQGVVATNFQPAVDRGLSSAGQPLESHTRAFFEPRFGRDLGPVQVHTDSAAEEFTHDLSAKALALGHHVYFSRGRYQPHTFAGQKLIAHELSHIVASGAQGPDRPMLNPDPPEEHEARLRAMLSGRRFREARFWDYLQAHADSLDVAQAVLLDGVAHDGGQRRRHSALLNRFLRRFPDRRQNMEEAVRTNTDALRTTARANVQAMWDQYESAAFLYAMVQWATERLGQQRGRSPRRRRGAPPAEPSPLEAQYAEWLATANERFAEVRAQRSATFAAANSALTELMNASGPLSYAQEQLLNDLNNYMQGGVAAARRQRLRSFYNLQTLLYTPSRRVLEQYGAAQQRQTAAGTRVTETRAQREALEVVPEGETARARSQRQRSLGAARRGERRAAGESARAERALTTTGAASPEMREYLVWRGTNPAETTAALQQQRTTRDTRLDGLLPTEAREGVDLAVVLNDTQRWSIYHRALANIGGGFPGFSQELTAYTVIRQRSRIIADQRAAGIASNVSEGTYHGHGEGQYDINAAAGANVVAVQPDTVDLTRILGADTRVPGARTFTRIASHVRSVSDINPDSGDADVLAKLVYGFFGRAWSREQVAAYFDGSSGARLPARAPDASRVLAGLLFEHTIAGSPVTRPIETRRVALRGLLEEAIRADLANLPAHRIVVPAGDAILDPVNASTGQFGGVSMVRIGTFRALTNPRTGQPFTREQATATVMGSARRVLLTDTSIISGIDGLMRMLRTGHRGDRSGPAVELVHHYREDATGQEAWVVVAYRHLRQIAAGLADDQPVTREQLIANVGSSGNAVSPHVHMSITVYDANPGRFARREPIGFLEPLDFFPMMRRARGRSGAAAPSPGTPPPATPEAPGAAGAAPPPSPQGAPAIQRQQKDSETSTPAVPPAFTQRIASSSGQTLSPATREFFEPRLGVDLAGVKIHEDTRAAEASQSLRALAFTVGRDVFFDANQYSPDTEPGKKLLAHELAHVAQQDRGTVSLGLSHPDDQHERAAQQVATDVMTGGKVPNLRPQASITNRAPVKAVQRQYSTRRAPTPDPNALIPIADFIMYVEAVERTYSSDTPAQTVTRLRQQYYLGFAFSQLIPDAPTQEMVRESQLIMGPGGAAYIPAQTRTRMIDPSIGAAAYSHLTAHADENAIGDNPSPYIVMADGSRIDAGHLLLALDSLLHPRVADPYASYGIPGIDPGGLAADLALASFWTSYHLREGHPHSDAAIQPATADFNAYYAASAPTEDILGDVDAFGTHATWTATPGQPLSQVLRAYYLGVSGGPPGVDRRWRTFCAANGFGYSVSGGTVTWNPGIATIWLPRINRLCDLFYSGFFSRVGSMTVGTAPSPGMWPFSAVALARFLVWLKPRLEAEIAAHP